MTCYTPPVNGKPIRQLEKLVKLDQSFGHTHSLNYQNLIILNENKTSILRNVKCIDNSPENMI